MGCGVGAAGGAGELEVVDGESTEAVADDERPGDGELDDEGFEEDV